MNSAAVQKMLAENNDMWKGKFETQLVSFKDKMNHIKD